MASLRLLPLLILSALPTLAQNGSYASITLDASAYGPPFSPQANFVPANRTQINPAYMAVDPAGNVYFSEQTDIRKVTTRGIVEPVAGFLGAITPYDCCGGGDGGPALLAVVGPGRFSGGLAYDVCGNLWFGDARPAIRRISPSGVVNTVAPFGGGLAVDSKCNAYVVSQGVQKISADGGVTQYPHSTSRAWGSRVTGVAADNSGNVYMTNIARNVIEKITPEGVITTVAGNGTHGYSGDGGSASNAEIDNLNCLTMDAEGNLYFADSVRGLVRKVSTSAVITTVAGGGKGFGEANRATEVALTNPAALTTDSKGNLYIAEQGGIVPTVPYQNIGGDIRKVSPDGRIHTIAGLFLAGCCGDGGPLFQATFSGIGGIAQDAQGNVYVADPLQHKIRKITPELNITTIAGMGVEGFGGDNGPALQAKLNSPQSVAVDDAGNVYIADAGNNRIRKVTPAGIIHTIAGNGVPLFSGDGGPAAKASLSGPHFVLADHSGNLFIADTDTHRIRKIAPDGFIHTIAGNGKVGFAGDGGPAVHAELSIPKSLAVDANGNLYVADNPVHTIRKITPAGIITTFAGTPGVEGYAGDGGPATKALLRQPFGVAVDASGNLWIADTGNGAARKVTPDGIISSPGAYAGTAILPDAMNPGNLYGNLYPPSPGLTYAYLGALPFPPLPPSVPWIGLYNLAGSNGGAVAPGMVAQIRGGNLGPEQTITATLDASGKYDSLLDGVQVFFNGVAAPVLTAQASHIYAIVPFEIAGANTAAVQVEYNGVKSNVIILPVTATFPEILSIVNQDGVPNNPELAPQGSVVEVLVSGAGMTSPQEADGTIIAAPLPMLLAPAKAVIRYVVNHKTFVVAAPVVSALPALNHVAGTVQLSVQIPTLPGYAQSGAFLTIMLGGASASSGIGVQ